MNNSPPSFQSYWDNMTDEVAELAGSKVEIKPLPMRSNENSNAYSVQFTGVEDYPLFGYLSIPLHGEHFAGLLQTPSYGSVVGLPSYERRAKYVVLALSHRGQRLSDQPFAASYPGLLTEGLPEADTYIWRNIVADCLRAFDILKNIDSVETSRLAVTGNDLALITASFREEISTLIAGQLLFRGTSERLTNLNSYPLKELTDFVEHNPNLESQVAQTLALFDPVAFVSRTKAETLVTCSNTDLERMRALENKTTRSIKIKVESGRGFLDLQYTENWLAQHL